MPSYPAPASRTLGLRRLASLLAFLGALSLPRAAAQGADVVSGGPVSAAPTLDVKVGLLGADNWPFSGYQPDASGQMQLQGFEASAPWMGSAAASTLSLLIGQP